MGRPASSSPPPTNLFLRIVKRESTPAGEVRADRMVVHHHRERTVHSDVRVHQALELLRVVVALVPRDDQSSTVPSSEKRDGAGFRIALT